MKKLLLLSVLLASCGENNMVSSTDPQLDFGDWVGDRANEGRDYFDNRGLTSEDVNNGYTDAQSDLGKEANGSRQYFSDRNVSSGDAAQGYVDAREDTAQGYVDAKDDAGKAGNEARGHMSDRNMSSGDVAQGYTEARTDVGEEANGTRKYVYERGIQEMRFGDQDTKNDITSNITRLDDAEARLTLIEQINSSQSSLIKILFSLSSSETAARKQATQDETAARMQADSAETADRMQADADQSASFAQSLADTTAFFSDITADLQDQLDDLSSEVTGQGLAIDAAEGRLDSVDDQLEDLRDRADEIERINRLQNRKLRNLRRDLTDLEGDLANEVTARGVAVAEERLARQGSDIVLGVSILASSQYAASQLQAARVALQSQINTLVTGATNMSTRVGALEGRVSAAESAILDASATAVALQTAVSTAVTVLLAADASLSDTVGTLTATVNGHTTALVAQGGRITTLEGRKSCSISLVPLPVFVTGSGFDGTCSGMSGSCKAHDFDQDVYISIPQVICI